MDNNTLLDNMVEDEEQKFAFYNNESATDVYKSMAAGTAQVNAMSDFFQESENDTRRMSPMFKGTGFNLGYELPYIEIVGPKSEFNSSNVQEQTTYYNEARIEPFMSLCKQGETTGTCMKRVFECDPDRPWKECNENLQTCKDDIIGNNICKYGSNGTLLKKYEPPPKKTEKEVNVQMLRIG